MEDAKQRKDKTGGGKPNKGKKNGSQKKQPIPSKAHENASKATTKRPIATDEASTEAKPTTGNKKLKVAKLTLDMFDGDAAAWFEALHEHANPSLSKMERGIHKKKVIHAEGDAWRIIKPVVGKAKPEKGDGPLALIVSASADRSCIMAKQAHRSPGSIAKLFARHMKVPEQQEFLQNNAVSVAVGTPNRLLKLGEDGILKLDKLRFLVIDMFMDVKTFTVLNMPEVARDFFSFFRQFVATLSQDLTIVLLTPGATSEAPPKAAPKQKAHKSNKIIIKDPKELETEGGAVGDKDPSSDKASSSESGGEDSDENM